MGGAIVTEKTGHQIVGDDFETLRNLLRRHGAKAILAEMSEMME